MLTRWIACYQLEVLLVVSVITGTLASMKSLLFQLQVDPQGLRLCSNNDPSIILSLPFGSTFVDCALACTITSTCQFYQFKTNVAHCEIFSYLPKDFDVNDQCIGFTAQTSELASVISTSSVNIMRSHML